MASIQYNDAAFRLQFPVYSDAATYPQATIQQYWNNATAYLSNQIGNCFNGMNLNQQTLALNLMTAHLLTLSLIIAANSTPGIVTGATIDKISVTLEPPPETNQWQWWLNQTPYGQQLLALLQIAAAGGRFYTGRPPVATAFRF
jgi:hypothetical protein